MKVIKRTTAALLSAMLASASLGIVGCERDGPVEEAGEEIGDTIDDVGDEIDDAVDETTDER